MSEALDPSRQIRETAGMKPLCRQVLRTTIRCYWKASRQTSLIAKSGSGDPRDLGPAPLCFFLPACTTMWHNVATLRETLAPIRL